MIEREKEIERELEIRAKSAFDESVGALDAVTRRRLADARRAALVELRSPGFGIPWLSDNFRAVAATVAVALMAGWLFLPSREQTSAGLQSIAAVSDFELLLEADEFEMLEELEFFAWLEEQPDVDVHTEALDGSSDDGAG